MEELTAEELRRAEAVAGDYHPGPRHHGVDESLARAAELLRARCVTRGDTDARGQLACAQLLEEIDRERRHGEHPGEGLVVVARRVAGELLELAAPSPPVASPTAPPPTALIHCRPRASGTAP